MQTFALTTLGCKVNQYESQQIRQLLVEFGLTQTNLKGRPDMVIVNSCCVTHSASAKSRQIIKRAKRLNPHALIVLCGCLAAISFDEALDKNDNVCIVKDKSNLASTLRNIIFERKSAATLHLPNTHIYETIKTENSHKIKSKKNLDNNLALGPLRSFEGHTRAFLKIQDGCDGYCSYCIIPRARPYVHCKKFVNVIEEARALVDSGHKEIVLTGVFLGAYGQDTVIRKKWPGRRNEKLAELLAELAQVEGLQRIRLSSLEPGDVTKLLLDVFCNYRNIMPHLHLSLQSGSDEVLRRMRRQYTAGKFEQVVEKVKERLQVPAITADIIVGFPGETEEDFEKTLIMAEKTGFSKMHVFPFSVREGTAAAKMQGLVNTKVMKKRAERMHQLDQKLQREFRQLFVNKEVTVLMEGSEYGRCERYFKVYVNDKSLKANDLVKVRITGDGKDGAVGQLK